MQLLRFILMFLLTGLVMILLMALSSFLLILMLLILVWHPLRTTVISSHALLVAQSKTVEKLKNQNLCRCSYYCLTLCILFL
jgi:hypothetical protein